MIEYRIRPDGLMQHDVCEIWRDGVLIGTLSEGVEPIATLHLTTKYDAAATRVAGTFGQTTLAIMIRVRQ